MVRIGISRRLRDGVDRGEDVMTLAGSGNSDRSPSPPEDGSEEASPAPRRSGHKEEMIEMAKRHEVQILRRAGHSQCEIAARGGSHERLGPPSRRGNEPESLPGQKVEEYSITRCVAKHGG